MYLQKENGNNIPLKRKMNKINVSLNTWNI